MSMTSCSSLNLMTTATGPKISSCATRQELFGTSMSVGLRNAPLARSPSVARSPPQRTLPPSCLAMSTYSRILFIWPWSIWLPIWVSSSQGMPTFT